MCKPSEDTGLTQLSLYLPGAQLGGSPADVSDELECLQQGGGWAGISKMASVTCPAP